MKNMNLKIHGIKVIRNQGKLYFAVHRSFKVIRDQGKLHCNHTVSFKVMRDHGNLLFYQLQGDSRSGKTTSRSYQLQVIPDQVTVC